MIYVTVSSQRGRDGLENADKRQCKWADIENRDNSLNKVTKTHESLFKDTNKNCSEKQETKKEIQRHSDLKFKGGTYSANNKYTILYFQNF